MPVVTYGTTKDFPAFYSGRSGFSVCPPRSRLALVLMDFTEPMECE